MNTKDKIDKIAELFKNDERDYKGYFAMKSLRNTFPEDYNELRTTWSRLQDIADQMYYLLDDIKDIIDDNM